MTATSSKPAKICPECGAKLRNVSYCWLCGRPLSKGNADNPPKIGESPLDSTLGALTCAGMLMALLLGAALLFIFIPFGLLYLALVVPAMISILVMLKREPGEKGSFGRVLLDIVMTLSITLGTIALLIGGAFVALVIMCLLEGSGSGTIMVR